MSAARGAGAFRVWRVLCTHSCANSPDALCITVLALALGVALGAAVYLVNSAALNEFGLATKRLVGEADVVVRGPREGFPDSLFTELARDPAVRLASPVLELEVALPGSRDTLTVLGLDPFRAAALQPALIGEVEAGALELFQPDAIMLSSAAARELRLEARRLAARHGRQHAAKRCASSACCPKAPIGQPLGVMDIASAQWIFERLGRLNRIDLG